MASLVFASDSQVIKHPHSLSVKVLTRRSWRVHVWKQTGFFQTARHSLSFSVLSPSVSIPSLISGPCSFNGVSGIRKDWRLLESHTSFQLSLRSGHTWWKAKRGNSRGSYAHVNVHKFASLVKQLLNWPESSMLILNLGCAAAACSEPVYHYL